MVPATVDLGLNYHLFTRCYAMENKIRKCQNGTDDRNAHVKEMSNLIQIS